ncbi:DUF2802 domain-containing protein [Zoogloea sp.]|uniref:DUF2802 domain-containing protein n=1 Tax=Zoogloea sp. TaxID=49181 RepID=UPI002607761C|nr:DUF2802 domain-containing protein [Zoogloea sp.]MDD3353423.1 DUF2802 domain-containing protein [Zoogloea sp.]
MIELDVGVREAIWALVAVLAIYLAVVLARLARPGGLKSGTTEQSTERLQERPLAPSSSLTGGVGASGALTTEDESVARELFNELEFQQLRRDVTQLRTEVDFLRRELALTRRGMDELRDSLQQQAAQDVQATRQESWEREKPYARPESPQHSEAMLLASRGVDAIRIAEHCGISVAEAELVCALARAEGNA